MWDSVEEVAGRLERAADRMANAGHRDLEHQCRQAVYVVRNGMPLDEAQEIERQILGERPDSPSGDIFPLAESEYD